MESTLAWTDSALAATSKVLPPYSYSRQAMRILGSICPKRSSAPATPKSGEHEDHTPPTLAVASMPITASGPFGSQAATRSPGRTPRSRSSAANRAVAR